VIDCFHAFKILVGFIGGCRVFYRCLGCPNLDDMYREADRQDTSADESNITLQLNIKRTTTNCK
ncbi:MAG TPA: hypothetical protein VIP56_05190, partial [Nitrososphaeraceae archaeon]